MKKVLMIYSESTEATFLESFIKLLNIPVKVERPQASVDMYKKAAKDTNSIYVMGKTFLHGTKVKKYEDFRRIFRSNDFKHLLFIEKPPFRFKQGSNDKVNNNNCGVLLSKISSFVNYHNLRNFLDTNYNKIEISRYVSRFRKHWLKYNEPKKPKIKTKNLIYFPLQLPQDASLRTRGAETYPCNEMISTVYKVFSRMYNDFKLVVREHPYHKKHYKYQLDFKDASKFMITNTIPHADLLTYADVVVSFNSSCLAEAVLFHKKILYFSNLPVIDCPGLGYRIPSWSYFSDKFLNETALIVRDYLTTEINEYLYNKYVYYIIKELSFFNNFTMNKDIQEFMCKRFGI